MAICLWIDFVSDFVEFTEILYTTREYSKVFLYYVQFGSTVWRFYNSTLMWFGWTPKKNFFFFSSLWLGLMMKIQCTIFWLSLFLPLPPWISMFTVLFLSRLASNNWIGLIHQFSDETVAVVVAVVKNNIFKWFDVKVHLILFPGYAQNQTLVDLLFWWCERRESGLICSRWLGVYNSRCCSTR